MPSEEKQAFPDFDSSAYGGPQGTLRICGDKGDSAGFFLSRAFVIFYHRSVILGLGFRFQPVQGRKSHVVESTAFALELQVCGLVPGSIHLQSLTRCSRV